MSEVAAFELVGLVRGELFDRERELAVVLEIFDQPRREVLGHECGQGAAVGGNVPSRDAMAVRNEVVVAAAGKRQIRVLLQKPDDLSRNGDRLHVDHGYERDYLMYPCSAIRFPLNL